MGNGLRLQAVSDKFFSRQCREPDIRQPGIEITGFKLFDKPVFIDSLLLENKPVQLSY